MLQNLSLIHAQAGFFAAFPLTAAFQLTIAALVL